MFCPECHGEYRAGIETCPTCEVPLKIHPPGDRARALEPRLVPQMVDLVGYVDEREGREARRRLRDAGVTCELVIRDGPGAGSGAGETEEFWLRVGGPQVRTAIDVLGLEAGLGEESCPACGSPMGEGNLCPGCGSRYEG